MEMNYVFLDLKKSILKENKIQTTTYNQLTNSHLCLQDNSYHRLPSILGI